MDPKLLVQSLKGSKAQVLWAFFFAMTAMDVDDVMAWTSLKRETCYQALDALEAVHLLGTQKAAHGRKVWLLGSEMLPVFQDLARHLGVADLLDQPQESGKRTAGELVVIDQPVARTPADLAELNAAFAKYAIIGKKKNELLACEWVTASYVHDHVEYSKAEGRNGLSVGMAITRMLAQVRQPERRANGHIENCECSRCKTDDFWETSNVICRVCHQYPCSCDEGEEE